MLEKISDFFIDNLMVTVVVLLLLIGVGLVSFSQMPQDAEPDVSVPGAMVTVIYPGASPSEIEREIAKELEERISAITELDSISVGCSESMCWAWVEFEASANLDDKLQELREKVIDASSEFPDDADDPEVREIDTSNIPAIIFSVFGDYSDVQLQRMAEDIVDMLETAPEVSRVDIYGGATEIVEIEIDPERLHARGIGVDQIVAALQADNFDMPAGKLDIGANRYLLRAMGKWRSLEDIENFVLLSRGGGKVRLKDVADVSFDRDEVQTFARRDGKACINLAVIKRKAYSAPEVSRAVQRVMDEEVRPTLPEDIEIYLAGDQADRASQALNTMTSNARSGGILVVLLLFAIVGFRNSLLVASAIPLACLFAFIMMNAKGYSFNGVTLFGIIVVLGILVDDSIIVVENTFRLMQQGKTRMQAAKQAIHEVGVAIVAAGLTTICAFAPMTMMSGVTGIFMAYFANTVVFAILGAILLAHTLVPALCARLLVIPRDKAVSNTGDLSPFRPLRNAMAFIHGGVKNFVSRMQVSYQRTLTRNVKYRWLVCGVSFAIFIGTVCLISLLDVEFFPTVKQREFEVSINAGLGTSLGETDRLARRVEDELVKLEDLETFVTNVGSDSISTGSFFSGGLSGSHTASITVTLFEREERRYSIDENIQKIRDMLDTIPGATFEIVERSEGPPTGAPVSVNLYGEEFETLGAIAEQVKGYLAEIPGTRDIGDNFDDNSPEIRFDIDRDRLASYGLSYPSMALALRTAFQGFEIGEFDRGDDVLEIKVRFPRRTSPDNELLNADRLADLSDLYFTSHSGALVPLDAVLTPRITTGFGSLRRLDRKRVINVDCNLHDGYNAADTLRKLTSRMDQMNLPTGYTWEVAGENEDRDESFGSLAISGTIAVFLIILILLLLFDSVLQPMVIMTAIPFGVVGVVLGLLITNQAFGFMAFIGIVALAGVVVNDAIVMIDHINLLRKRGLDKLPAVIEGAGNRMRPIIMTSVTTILGILPLVIGFEDESRFWRPLGNSIIFGLMASTILNLLVLPGIYMIFTDFEEWAGRVLFKMPDLGDYKKRYADKFVDPEEYAKNA